MVITVSDIHGVKQYSISKYMKLFLTLSILLVLFVLLGVGYTIYHLNDKVVSLEHANSSLSQNLLKDKSIYGKYEALEKTLVSLEQTQSKLSLQYKTDKLALKKKLTDKIEKLTALKNSFESKNRLTENENIENSKLLDALAKEMMQIEKALSEETKRNKKLQKKLSKNMKIKKDKLKVDKKRKASLLKQKLKRENLLKKIAKSKLGKRYVWGAIGPGVFDCSGFTSYVYKKAGVNLPRTSIIQAKYGKYIKRKDLQTGDLIFFDTSRKRKGYVNHVGIYLGNNKFIHASSAKKKVVITSLNKPFYSGRYKWARRVH